MANFVPRGEWRVFDGGPEESDYWGRWYYEHDGLSMFGVNVYIEAIEIKVIEDIQYAANPKWQDEFHSLGMIMHADGPIETIEIDGKPAVIFITPHCS
jgi:hypothetical protein